MGFAPACTAHNSIEYVGFVGGAFFVLNVVTARKSTDMIKQLFRRFC